MTARDRTPGSGPRRWDAALLAAGLAGYALRLVLCAVTEGSNDIRTWELFAREVQARGLEGTYLAFPIFNHPPLMGLWAAAVLRLAAATGLRFTVLFKLLGVAAEVGTGLLLAATSYCLFLVAGSGFGVQYAGCVVAWLLLVSLTAGLVYATVSGVFIGLAYVSFLYQLWPAASLHLGFPLSLIPLGFLTWACLVYLLIALFRRREEEGPSSFPDGFRSPGRCPTPSSKPGRTVPRRRPSAQRRPVRRRSASRGSASREAPATSS